MKNWVLGVLIVLALPLNAAEPTTFYFVGEERTVRPDGGLIQSAAYVGFRAHLPEEKLIKVDILYLRTGKPVEHHLTVKNVEGDRFTLADPGGAFTGTGELFGDAWNWKKWNYQLKFTNGSTMTGEDEATDKGILMHKKFFSAAGAHTRSVLGDFRFVNRETYEQLAGKLNPQE